jgi:hypothetical protein
MTSTFLRRERRELLTFSRNFEPTFSSLHVLSVSPACPEGAPVHGLLPRNDEAESQVTRKLYDDSYWENEKSGPGRW